MTFWGKNGKLVVLYVISMETHISNQIRIFAHLVPNLQRYTYYTIKSTALQIWYN